MIVIRPSQEDELPSEAGVYGFFILLASRQRVGLLGGEPYSSDVLLNAKGNLERRLVKIQKLISSRVLDGMVREQNKSQDASDFYEVLLSQKSASNIVSAMDGAKIDSLPKVVDALEKASLMASPIYCGMTSEQTLEQRYKQHKANFYGRSDREVFGARLLRSGLSWDDLIFGCIPLSTGRLDIRSIERLMHILLKAPLSNI
ncbi:hypothetical protein [Pseudomonas aeruginosa]|uniref:hypothetical protein n=1 Tax=Pseudomonas aeruginosa TaxID=287 RepID=UPI000F546955|nr:hypothetical protein [Pseudomonas aeruginosa]MBH4112495.1 hypothetical protein [Pseudomonas aeruginosa]MBV6233654.1 hypothetical protein [Pseudomonas aeruginosa]MBX5604735.1 hypothetical protein [Pseudomonas aeruginosa]MCS7933324.1 hypothetical protein [Pseudomonas aeruginosa]MCS8162825.1 hypothetical protein [Pseudomonas aeruginosa]